MHIYSHLNEWNHLSEWYRTHRFLLSPIPNLTPFWLVVASHEWKHSVTRLNNFIRTYNPLKHHQPLSLALLVAKCFIYKCNLNEQSLRFSLFKIQLRENIMTERYITIKNKNAKLFNEKWKCLILIDFVPEILPPPTSQ